MRNSRAPRHMFPLLPLALLLVVGCDPGGGSHPSGTLETPTLDLAPLVTGRVLSVRVEEGERVAAGDTLLVVDTTLLALQREEALAAQRGLLARRRASEAELAQARRQLGLLQSTLKRVRALAEAGSASGQRVDDLSTERDRAADGIAAAEAGLAAVDADLDRTAAGIALLDRQLADGIVIAPIDGTLLLRTAEPGEVLAAGRSALRLANLDALELRIYLEAEDLDRVRLDAELPVRVDALRDTDAGGELRGRVVWISDEAEFTPKNAQTRDARAQLVYAVKLRVDNPDGLLHLGMSAEVKLP